MKLTVHAMNSLKLLYKFSSHWEPLISATLVQLPIYKLSEGGYPPRARICHFCTLIHLWVLLTLKKVAATAAILKDTTIGLKTGGGEENLILIKADALTHMCILSIIDQCWTFLSYRPNLRATIVGRQGTTSCGDSRINTHFSAALVPICKCVTVTHRCYINRDWLIYYTKDIRCGERRKRI